MSTVEYLENVKRLNEIYEELNILIKNIKTEWAGMNNEY